MQITPVIAIHLSAALSAVVLGPIALWARRGHGVGVVSAWRSRLHRAAGYAWVTLMLVTAVSAVFIRDVGLPNIMGYTPIHILVLVVFVSLFMALRNLFKGDIRRHRAWMIGLYWGACVGAGLFTLLPGRYLGQLLWG